MTAPPTRRPTRRTLVIGGVLAVVALLAVVAALLLTRSDDPGDAAGSPPSTPAGTSAGTSDPAATAAPTPPPPPVTPAPTGPTEDVDEPPAALPGVGLTEQVQAPAGIAAQLVDVSVVQVTGQGAGSISGPALRVVVELTNGSDTELPLSGVDVTADTGESRAPAPPVDDGQTRGLVGAVAPGGTSTGTYLFSLPAEQAAVTVTVGYAAGAPLMVFSGDVGQAG